MQGMRQSVLSTRVHARCRAAALRRLWFLCALTPVLLADSKAVAEDAVDIKVITAALKAHRDSIRSLEVDYVTEPLPNSAQYGPVEVQTRRVRLVLDGVRRALFAESRIPEASTDGWLLTNLYDGRDSHTLWYSREAPFELDEVETIPHALGESFAKETYTHLLGWSLDGGFELPLTELLASSKLLESSLDIDGHEYIVLLPDFQPSQVSHVILIALDRDRGWLLQRLIRVPLVFFESRMARHAPHKGSSEPFQAPPGSGFTQIFVTEYRQVRGEDGSSLDLPFRADFPPFSRLNVLSLKLNGRVTQSFRPALKSGVRHVVGRNSARPRSTIVGGDEGKLTYQERQKRLMEGEAPAAIPNASQGASTVVTRESWGVGNWINAGLATILVSAIAGLVISRRVG